MTYSGTYLQETLEMVKLAEEKAAQRLEGPAKLKWQSFIIGQQVLADAMSSKDGKPSEHLPELIALWFLLGEMKDRLLEAECREDCKGVQSWLESRSGCFREDSTAS